MLNDDGLAEGWYWAAQVKKSQDDYYHYERHLLNAANKGYVLAMRGRGFDLLQDEDRYYKALYWLCQTFLQGDFSVSEDLIELYDSLKEEIAEDNEINYCYNKFTMRNYIIADDLKLYENIREDAQFVVDQDISF